VPQNGPMDPKHAILFEPVRIGPKTLPKINRADDGTVQLFGADRYGEHWSDSCDERDPARPEPYVREHADVR
jgi:hypothetical protein